MKNFSDFGIKQPELGFVGTKIQMKKLFNEEIIVEKFKVEPSNFKGDRLKLQIRFNNLNYVVFTGSVSLIEQASKLSEQDLPFKTKIIEKQENFLFT